MSAFGYVRKTYGVPAALGCRVTVSGQPGVITEDRGHYIGVTFDSDKPGVVRNAHPTSEVQYLGMGTVRPMTASQQRYQRFLDVGECFEDFRSFLLYDAQRAKS